MTFDLEAWAARVIVDEPEVAGMVRCAGSGCSVLVLPTQEMCRPCRVSRGGSKPARRRRRARKPTNRKDRNR